MALAILISLVRDRELIRLLSVLTPEAPHDPSHAKGTVGTAKREILQEMVLSL